MKLNLYETLQGGTRKARAQWFENFCWKHGMENAPLGYNKQRLIDELARHDACLLLHDDEVEFGSRNSALLFLLRYSSNDVGWH